jgi:hypothetical protein
MVKISLAAVIALSTAARYAEFMGCVVQRFDVKVGAVFACPVAGTFT